MEAQVALKKLRAYVNVSLMMMSHSPIDEIIRILEREQKNYCESVISTNNFRTQEYKMCFINYQNKSYHELQISKKAHKGSYQSIRN